jgi:hypothetical protein
MGCNVRSGQSLAGCALFPTRAQIWAPPAWLLEPGAADTFFTYALVVFALHGVCAAMVQISYAALFPSVFPTPAERIRASVPKQWCTIIGLLSGGCGPQPPSRGHHEPRFTPTGMALPPVIAGDGWQRPADVGRALGLVSAVVLGEKLGAAEPRVLNTCAAAVLLRLPQTSASPTSPSTAATASTKPRGIISTLALGRARGA